METLIVYLDSKKKLDALKAVMPFNIPSEILKEYPAQSITEDIRESMKEVKLHESGKIKLSDARDLLNEI